MICKLAPGFSAWAHEPLINKFPNLQMPVSILCGENDWLTFDGLPELYQQGKLPTGSVVEIVPETGHQIQLDSPVFTSKHIMEFIFGGDRKE